MPHQVDGISWLRHAFLSGMPGAAGRRHGPRQDVPGARVPEPAGDGEGGGTRPILIVAPKKLLDNWLEEVAEHIGPEGLGVPSWHTTSTWHA